MTTEGDFGYYWKKRFDDAALCFHTDAANGLWSEQGFRRRFEAFLNAFEEASARESLKILDIGCGTGVYDRALTEMGHDVIGIDYSKQTVHKAVEKSKKGKPQYLISAAIHLPFKDDSFDLVMCIGVLQYVKNEKVAINEMLRVLNENEGSLLLITLNSLCIREISKRLLVLFSNKNIAQTNINERRYNPFKFKKQLINFNTIKIDGIYIYPEKLISLEKVTGKILRRLYPLSLLVAHAFLIKAKR